MSDRKETTWKKLDEEVKHLDRLQGFVFGAIIAVSVATFREEETYKMVIGSVFVLILFVLLFVLIIVRNRKIKSY